MNTLPSRRLVYFLLTLFALVLSTWIFFNQEIGSKTHGALVALAEKVRENHETTKIGGDIAVKLGLRAKEEQIPAHTYLVVDGKEHHAIAVTEANDIVLIFGTGSVAYFCLTDLSGKLRRVVMAEPGTQETDVPVSDALPRFKEEVAFWKTYLRIAE